MSGFAAPKGAPTMTHDAARAIIRDYYGNLADTGDSARLRGVVAFLSATLAEHMAWDAALQLATWIEQHDAPVNAG